MNIFLMNVAYGRGWGGLEAHTHLLAALFHRRGHSVAVGCWNEGSVTVAGGITVPSKKIWIVNAGDVAAIAKMAGFARQQSAQVIIANCGREYWPAAIAARLAGAKVVLIRHQMDRIRLTTRWLINKHVDAVIAVSSAVRNVLIKSGVDSDKATVIPNFIDLEAFEPSRVDREAVRKEFGFTTGDTIIGAVGKLVHGKGVDDLLMAFKKLMYRYPAAKLLFVGAGLDQARLQQEVELGGLNERVVFAGVRNDVARMYRAMDIFALPSHNEGLPSVLLEAMAMATPVVATTVGGIPELVTDGVNGLLVRPQDADGLAQAIARYIDAPAFALSLAEEGRRSICGQLSEQAIGDSYERVLNRIR